LQNPTNFVRRFSETASKAYLRLPQDCCSALGNKRIKGFHKSVITDTSRAFFELCDRHGYSTMKVSYPFLKESTDQYLLYTFLVRYIEHEVLEIDNLQLSIFKEDLYNEVCWASAELYGEAMLPLCKDEFTEFIKELIKKVFGQDVTHLVTRISIIGFLPFYEDPYRYENLSDTEICLIASYWKKANDLRLLSEDNRENLFYAIKKECEELNSYEEEKIPEITDAFIAAQKKLQEENTLSYLKSMVSGYCDQLTLENHRRVQELDLSNQVFGGCPGPPVEIEGSGDSMSAMFADY
jgi:hypothetical protein